MTAPAGPGATWDNRPHRFCRTCHERRPQTAFRFFTTTGTFAEDCDDCAQANRAKQTEKEARRDAQLRAAEDQGSLW